MDLHNLKKIPESQTVYGTGLLKTLPSRTKLFDNVSGSESDYSELSAPFSDVVYSVEVESKRKAKEIHGKDLYTAFSFSPEFKTAMEEVKREMIKENPNYLKTESLVAENLEDIKSRVMSPCRDIPTKGEKSYKFLEFPDDKVEEVEEEEKEVVKDKKKKTKIWLDEEETPFDTMSGYWRLLSGFDEFKISPPWYDAYAEGKEHWLQTNPISTEVFENSRNKCLNWLKKYFEK